MRPLTRSLVWLPLFCALGACTLNRVRPLPEGAAPQDDAAVVVYGVGVEGEWKFKSFGVELDQYDIARQKITGDCYRFNRTEAAVSAAPGVPSYFAFEVPAGYYAYSPFNGGRLAQNPGAFAAPPASVVYIGDFIYARDGEVALRRNLDVAKSQLDAQMPSLRGKIRLAEAIPSARSMSFICTF